MSIEWKSRNDIILPYSEWPQNQFSYQTFQSDNRQMQTAQQNTKYEKP